MEVGEENLILAKHRAFVEIRLLDLDNEGLGEGLRPGADASTGNDVVSVAESDACPGVLFDDDGVPVPGQLGNGGGGESDAVFVDLGLLGDANAHCLRLCGLPVVITLDNPGRNAFAFSPAIAEHIGIICDKT